MFRQQLVISRELARADVNCVITPVPGTNDNTAWAIAKVSRVESYVIILKLMISY